MFFKFKSTYGEARMVNINHITFMHLNATEGLNLHLACGAQLIVPKEYISLFESFMAVSTGNPSFKLDL